MNYYVISNELYHHGILGQKWGVRRYQNEDGTLTEAGKKRYYTTDQYGNRAITEAGRRYNAEKSKKVERYAAAVAGNVRKNNPDFNKTFQEYKDLNKKNNEHYLNEREKWFNQEDKYKGKDYYEFKDISADDWNSTVDAKREREVWNQLEGMIRSSAKEHPLYNKTYRSLNDYVYEKWGQDFISEHNYGDMAVKQVIGQLYYETVKEQKHHL